MPTFRSDRVLPSLLVGIFCVAFPQAFGQPAAQTTPLYHNGKMGPAFSLEKWKEQYGRPLILKEWLARNPHPWSSYFSGGNAQCEKNWFFELGPLGARVAWRDVTRREPAWLAAFPESLRDNGLPIGNAIEVIEVSADGPAAGQLQKGDLIVAIDGQSIRSPEYTFFDRTLTSKGSRMLEIHAGQLIDAAEGRGHIRLQVLRGGTASGMAGTEIPATDETTRSQSIEAPLAGAASISLIAESINKDSRLCWVNWIAPRLEGPAGTLDLSQLPPASATSGYKTVQYGKDVLGKPVMFDGKTAPSVIGTHANSIITWVVPAGYDTLKATVQTPQSVAVKCRVQPHAAMPYKQWIPIAERAAPKSDKTPAAPADEFALPLAAELPEHGILCFAATGPAQFEEVQLKDAAGHSLTPTQLQTVFNSYGAWPSDGRLSGPFQFEFRLPPGKWILAGSVRGESGVDVHCGVFPALTLPPGLAANAKELEFDIPKLGSFGGRFHPGSEKLKNYSAMLAARLAIQQLPNGSWEGVPGSYSEPAFHSAIAALGLMATGDPAYDENVRRAARWMASFDYSLGYGARSGGWCYPMGLRLMFLSEYHLRTGDQTVLPAIQSLVDLILRSCLTADYVSGHKMWTPGYQGSGWLGATGTILQGLATARHTPAKVDPKVLTGMFDVIQEYGLTYGGLPYGRGGQLRRDPPRLAPTSFSKGGGAGNGLCVMAALMGAGNQGFAEYSKQRFGQPPWGDEDGGHATHTLPYIWSSLACSLISPAARRGNMEAFLWRLTLQRDYAGFINNNNNALEFHGGESVIGKPYFSTGGILLVLNADKKNLFMTGKEKYRTPPRKAPWTQMIDRRFRMTTGNNWNIVEAALPGGAPAAMKAALAKLRAIPENAPGMDQHLFNFLRTDAPRAASAVLEMPGVPEPTRSWCAEMLLGIQDGGKYFTRKAPAATDELVEYTFNPQLAAPHALWKQENPPAASQWSGTVTLSDPAGKHPENPVVVPLTPGQPIVPATVLLPSKAYPLVATYDYVLEGVRIHYQRPMNAVPVKEHENWRKFLVRASIGEVMESYAWRWPLKLSTGARLEATCRESKPVLLRLPDGTEKKFDNMVPLRPEQRYELLVGDSNHWGESPVYEVRILK